MAKRRNEPQCPDCGRALMTKKDLQRLSLSLGAAAAVLGTAAEIIDEAIADGGDAMKALHLLRSWWLGMRADALSEDIEEALPEVTEQLAGDAGEDEPHAEPAAIPSTSGPQRLN